jgi:hypothetical protein
LLRTSRTLLLSLGLASLLSAATVNYNPAPTTVAGWSPCTNYAGYVCKTTAYFDAQSLSDQNDDQNINGLFQSAFDAWNASGGGQGWTLNYGGSLTGTFDVTTATANQFGPVVAGGLTINIDVSNITLPTPGANQQLVWVQGLFINYTVPAGTIVTPYFAMDTSTLSGLTCGGTIFCPPAYPYQYLDNSFYDQPFDAYMPPGTTQAFFDANAYLALESTNGDKILTVYDGVSYGFQNYVSPEPGAWLLFGSGFVMLLVIRRRRVAA